MKYVFVIDEQLYFKTISYKEHNNFWLTDYKNENIIYVKCDNNQFTLFSNKKYKILESEFNKNNFLESITITENQKYIFYNLEENKILYFYTYNLNESFQKNCYSFNNSIEKISIGGVSYSNADIVIQDKTYDNSYISFYLNEKNIKFENNSFPYNVYKNNYTLDNEYIKYGDYIFFDGILIVILRNLIIIYNSNDRLILDNNIFKLISNDLINYDKFKTDNLKSNINSLINFKRVPKIQRKIETKVFPIDGPSSPELKEEMPVVYTLLPMMLMSTTSMFTGINVINQISSGEKTIKEALPSLIIVFAMIGSMVIIPILTNAYRKRKQSKREIKRIAEYKDYIYECKLKIKEEMDFQKQVLTDTYYDTAKSKEIIETTNNLLWERKIDFEDFLCFSLGNGNVSPNIDVRIPQEHFTIDRDKLLVQLTKLEDEIEEIENVPIVFDFSKNNVVSFIGKNINILRYINNILIRIFAVCSYEDVKIVVFSNKENELFWKQYINLPYLWNEEKDLRFFCTDDKSYSIVINYLDGIYKERVNSITDNEQSSTSYTKYIIFIDDINSIKNIPMINDIIKTQNDYGFTIIFNTSKIDLLPSECKNFIYIENNSGKLISNVNKNYYEKDFIPELEYNDFNQCYENLSNIFLDSFEKKFILPNKLGFLEMYNVNNIESLNIKSNWDDNTTVNSLSVPIGINDNGDLLNLDLHEDAHGPHGLVAGMTGSGKSELLITYILSLAVNYSPYEVQFVLIDYKGGGLANTFYNSNIGMILPHVVGVITNINENEINRSLISLKSEVKRRQKIFAEVSIKYNEGNMDIYKYENIYRNHTDIEPLSHLFIISDEFAELKTQNPEFIEELISIARIGRSLGIHLILATQKPSGVVDDQIWSNSRFKICLKVQDKSDSNDMIKVPSAAYLKETGRFYLQVGFNELFIKAQSAYTGLDYFKRDNNEEIIDDSIDFLNNYGKKYFSYTDTKTKDVQSSGKEINNIVKTIIELSKQHNYNVRGLWRELIPENIYYNELIQKYLFNKTTNISCLIGEYDAPDLQKKGPVLLDLANNSNIAIYGLAGSGKEMLLKTMIYSLICNYNAEQIGLYIMDFGSETLNIFANAPQVGDVIYITENEKVNNAFKYFESILIKRKKLLANYNGDFDLYNKSNDKKLDNIIIVINVLENLFENYDDLADKFLKITRECNRYGITFVITTNGTNNVRTKLLQGFKTSIALDLKDSYDYTSVFANKIKVSPMKYKGRGLIKINNIYEFQTANINSEKDEVTSIEEVINYLNTISPIKTSAIPVLPEIVTYENIVQKLNNPYSLPIGINVDNLAINVFDFFEKNGVIISSLEFESMTKFIYSLEKNILSFKNNKLFIFNAYKKLENVFKLTTMFNDNFKDYLDKLDEYYSKDDGTNNNYIIFTGIFDIYDTFDITYKKKFSELLQKLNKSSKYSLIFIDEFTSIKKLEYEEFYKTNVNNLRGIWIGNGINDQTILKNCVVSREYRELTNPNYGFVLENSVVKKIKVINYTGENYEE